MPSHLENNGRIVRCRDTEFADECSHCCTNHECCRICNTRVYHPTSLYRMYGYGEYFDIEQLLYVGISDNFASRFGQHRNKDWLGDVTRTTVEHFYDRKAAEYYEDLAIKTEFPVHNRKGSAYIGGDPNIIMGDWRTVSASEYLAQAFMEGKDLIYIPSPRQICSSAILPGRDVEDVPDE